MGERRPNFPPRPWGELPRAQVTAGDGLVIVDKDGGVTSHDIVGAMRRLAATRKVGHAGTLDPMATGVLCIGIGKATKLLQYVTGTDKEYRATIRLGVETHTEDAQGDVVAVRGLVNLDGASLTGAIDSAMAPLRGDVLQRPSSVSAVKVDGKRAYARVREGEQVELAARPVHVERFERVGDPRHVPYGDTTVADVDVVVQCSAGTYVRALARDLGEALGTGAHLTALRRTRVGAWGANGARTVAQLAQVVADDHALPVVSVTELCQQLFSCVEVTPDEANALAHGQFIPGRPAEDGRAQEGRATDDMPLAAMCGGQAIALVSVRGTKLKPDLLLAR
ncbi:MAG: tRNA pseudouridine(55) synthase TruB [Ancrocorticia sp.]|uniref:tRNA pseudouridine(55) synthase TruB n=1 Tax=Ancrocorticia sp. TaxID=2593684 RepID=UPI003F90C5FF